MILENQFREIVDARLKTLGWSRSDLARAMGVRPGYVTSYLNSHRHPGSDVMERFFTTLGLRPTLSAVVENEEPDLVRA